MAMVEIPEEDVIDVPSLQTMPVLPADYPLFDWADWPDSRAALVAGGMTKRFEKACWNAILGTLADALNAAGLPAYDGGGISFPADLSMTEGKYGRLTAARMNHAVAALDDVVPLAWAWAYDKNFRGYIGRTAFLGLSSGKADTVYPEYILELVRRLNLILELMRGTYPYLTETSVSGHAESVLRFTMRAGQGVPIIRSLILPLRISKAPLTVGQGVRLDPKQLSRIGVDFRPELLKAADVELRMPITAPIKASGEVMRPGIMTLLPVISGTFPQTLVETTLPARLAASVLSHPAATAAVEQLEGMTLETGAVIRSLTAAGADRRRAVRTEARTQRFTTRQVTGDAVPVQKLERVKGYSRSKTTAAASTSRMADTQTHPLGLYTSSRLEGNAAQVNAGGATLLSLSRWQAEADSVPPLWLEAKETARLHSRTEITKLRTRPGWAEQKSGSRSVCGLGTAWDAPIWVDGGLWIRQARTVKVLPDGSLDLSGSGDPIAARLESRSRTAAVLDNIWDAPIWIDGGLFIRQVREVTVLADGSLDLTGSGDILKVKQESKSSVLASLDTGWYAPVWVDGGLFIQQVRAPKIRPDGGLDLSDSGDPLHAEQVGQTAVSCAVEVPGTLDGLESEQISKTNAACTLDTGWYPPVWVDGGLYLRQVFEDPTQDENGALEVR